MPRAKAEGHAHATCKRPAEWGRCKDCSGLAKSPRASICLACERLAASKRRGYTVPGTMSHDEAERRRAAGAARAARTCTTCWGMSWARRPDRRYVNEQQPNLACAPYVAGPDWRCRGCGEPYAPEPSPERDDTLHSSMGMVSDVCSGFE